MRNEPLHGYVLHQRAYRENSKLVNFLSFEAGRVDGVARQTISTLYQPTLIFATGKSGLKSFAKAESVGSAITLTGDALFAGFYLNELLVRLLPHQEPLPEVVSAYAAALQALAEHQPLIATLRRFELVLLAQLGYEIDFQFDWLGQPIVPTALYRFQRGEGFSLNSSGETGASLLAVKDFEILSPDSLSIHASNSECLAMLTRVLRNALAAQLGDQPLKSRSLWIASKPKISD